MKKIVTVLICLVVVAACSESPKLNPDDRIIVGEGAYIANQPVSEQDEIIQKQELVRRQNQEILRQQNEIQDIRRQQYHNQKMRDYGRKTFGNGEDSWVADDEELDRQETIPEKRPARDDYDDHY